VIGIVSRPRKQRIKGPSPARPANVTEGLPMLHFECPSCKMKCETDPQFAGQTVPCPRCKKPVVVPNPKSTGPGQAVVKDGAAGGSGLKLAIFGVVVMMVLAFIVIWVMQNEGDGGSHPVVVMETSMGTVKIELFDDKAPITVKNFLRYVDERHYDGTIFHRVIGDFMIQGGGMDPGLRERMTRAPIKNESGNGVRNVRGSIAMARTGELDSATSQFYINVVDNPSLDKGSYCAFGKVIEGMDVVDAIRRVETGNQGGHTDVPLKDVVIRSIRRVETKEPEKK
jgi:cyclophilin family peptidyl-prolyl cis-trans isomerase